MSSLTVECREDASIKGFLVTLIGTLDIFTYQDFRKTVSGAIGDRKSVRLLMDLTQVDYIASSGWAVLLTQAKAFRRAGGGMALYGMKEEVGRVYDVMNIRVLLPCASTLPEAAKLLEATEVKP